MTNKHAWTENAGWANAAPTNGGVTVHFDGASGYLTGLVWGENIGWVRFKGAAPDYNVRTVAFDKQPQGTPNWWLSHFAVSESYDAGDGVLAWKKYVMDTDPKVKGDYLRIMTISNLPHATVTFTSSARRYYTLQRRDDLQTSNWTNIVTQTDILGEDGLTTLQDANATNRQFYRVEVQVMP